MRIFKDESGQAYEVDVDLLASKGFIKPIKAVERGNYYLSFGGAKDLMWEEYNLTEPTAQKVAAYLEASLEAITTNNRRYFNGEVTECFKDAARAFQEEV